MIGGEVMQMAGEPWTRAQREEDARLMTGSLVELINHIERVHHEFERAELARLAPMIHTLSGPAYRRVALLFDAIGADLLVHMVKEEMILFPLIQELERTRRTPSAAYGSLRQTLAAMDHDHAEFLALLGELRAAIHDVALTDPDVGEHRALRDGLRALEDDLLRHVHLEDDILFPRVIALEGAVRQ